MTKRRDWSHGFLNRARLVAALTALTLAPSTLRAAPQDGPTKQSEEPSAEAAPVDDARAQAATRKRGADEAMDALRFADALEGYAEAYAITKEPALLYNMGRALQALNRHPEALDKLEAFEATAPAELKEKVPRLPKLIAELRQRVSTLTVKTNVAGARVLVRDTVIGKSPLAKSVRLAAGKATIEIEAEGYFPGKKTVELPGGSGIEVELKLFSKTTTGVLSVRASAAGAEVQVDGKRIGVAPLELNVPKGTHRVTVKHPDYRVYETSAVVPAGGTKSVVAELQSSSLVTRWWFWSAVGVVVTTGVVIGIAAVTERGADAGTIAPGQIRIESRPESPALFKF